MPYSNYPHGFVDGVAIKNIPVDFAISDKANVFWVDSVHGSDQDKGTFTRPVATIVQALTLCTASNGDIIYVAAGHIEPVISAAALAFSVADVTVIFLGEGSNRATINFTTSTLASMVITAANVTLIGPRFLNGINSLANPIMVLGANCKILNYEYHDATSKSTIIAIMATSVAGLRIDGGKYFEGSGGAAKASHLQILTLTSGEINNVDIVGNFSTGCIDLQAAVSTNLRIENSKLNNTNTGPQPCISQPAGTTGVYKNLDLRVYSGTTYISNLGGVSYDSSCLGYNSGGTSGDPVGGTTGTSIEGKVDAIQADVGDASARSNFPSLNAMIGVPDAVNSCLDDMIRTGFDSTAITSNANGSVMERLETIQAALTPLTSNLVIFGAADGGMVGSTTTVVSANLAGYGDGYFANKYYMQVIKNANSVGNAPETQYRLITAYTSTTGTFTVTAFGANVEASDSLMVIHESLAMAGRDDAANNVVSTNVVANADGSIVEREEYIQTAVAAVQTDIGDPSARTNFKSIEAMIGIPDAASSNLDDMIRSGFDSSAIPGNANGSVIEQLKYLQGAILPDLSGLVFSGTTDAGMAPSTTTVVCTHLAGYGNDFFNTKYYMQVIRNVNAVGVSPEPEIRQITAYVSTTGTFTTNAFGANVETGDSIMVLHQSLVAGTTAIGPMINTINTTANTINTNVGDPSGHTLTSITAKLGNGATTVTADLTTLKTNLGTTANTVGTQVDKIDKATLAVSPTAGSLATFIASGGTALGTALDTSKSIVDALGSNGTTVASNTTSVGGQVLLTKAEALKIDSATLAVSPTAGSLARFVASGGTALGTPLADSKSLINCLGTDGTTAAVATAASAVSLFGAIGTNEADATTPFDSTNVQANANGTVLEREEYIQAEVDKIDAVTLAVSPTAGSLARFVASGGTALGTQLADSKSIVDAIGSNGTTLVYGSGSALGAIGTTFWIKKTVTSSDILTASNLDITGTSSGGELVIEEVLLKTDNPGLAGGTNFELLSNNAKGLANICVETVANLGSLKTIDMYTASVTKQRTVLESGAKLQVHSTVGNCTGGGTIDIYVQFRRLAAGATIAIV